MNCAAYAGTLIDQNFQQIPGDFRNFPLFPSQFSVTTDSKSCFKVSVGKRKLSKAHSLRNCLFGPYL